LIGGRGQDEAYEKRKKEKTNRRGKFVWTQGGGGGATTKTYPAGYDWVPKQNKAMDGQERRKQNQGAVGDSKEDPGAVVFWGERVGFSHHRGNQDPEKINSERRGEVGKGGKKIGGPLRRPIKKRRHFPAKKKRCTAAWSNGKKGGKKKSGKRRGVGEVFLRTPRRVRSGFES